MKNYADVFFRLKEILNENGVDVVDENSRIEVDSLTIVSIIVSIEEIFQVSFPDSFFSSGAVLSMQLLAEMILDLENNKEAAIIK